MALYSQAVGWGARRVLPRVLRAPLYGAYARLFSVDLEEIADPISSFPTFTAFFTRSLRAGARPMAGADGGLMSPCDGTLVAAGKLSDEPIDAKGRGFSTAALVADPDIAERLRGGTFATLYLSPRDYHRVHAPAPLRLAGYRYVPGTLFPVNPYFSGRIDQIFAVNERLVFVDESGFVVVMVAAAGVGNMTSPIDEIESRHFRRGGVRRRDFNPPLEIERGDELGAFQLGSTVILLAPPGLHGPFTHPTGRGIRLGDELAGPGEGA